MSSSSVKVVETPAERRRRLATPFHPSRGTVLLDPLGQPVREASCPGCCGNDHSCGSWFTTVVRERGIPYLEFGKLLYDYKGIDLDPTVAAETTESSMEFPLFWETDEAVAKRTKVRKTPHLHVCRIGKDAECDDGPVSTETSECSCCKERVHSGEPIYGMLKLGPAERMSKQRLVP